MKQDYDEIKFTIGGLEKPLFGLNVVQILSKIGLQEYYYKEIGKHIFFQI